MTTERLVVSKYWRYFLKATSCTGALLLCGCVDSRVTTLEDGMLNVTVSCSLSCGEGVATKEAMKIAARSARSKGETRIMISDERHAVKPTMMGYFPQKAKLSDDFGLYFGTEFGKKAHQIRVIRPRVTVSITFAFRDDPPPKALRSFLVSDILGNKR